MQQSSKQFNWQHCHASTTLQWSGKFPVIGLKPEASEYQPPDLRPMFSLMTETTAGLVEPQQPPDGAHAGTIGLRHHLWPLTDSTMVMIRLNCNTRLLLCSACCHNTHFPVASQATSASTLLLSLEFYLSKPPTTDKPLAACFEVLGSYTCKSINIIPTCDGKLPHKEWCLSLPITDGATAFDGHLTSIYERSCAS